MRTLWLKVWVWTKAVAAALLLIYLLIFVTKNSGKPVDFWIWFNVQPDTTVLVLALYAFVAGIVFLILAVTAFRTIRQIRELNERNRMERTEKHINELHAKAATLREKPMPGDEAPPPA
jgi:uncharacterized integral membrane protein